MTQVFSLYWLTQSLADVPGDNDWLARGELETLSSKQVLKRRSDWRLGRWTAKRAFAACPSRTDRSYRFSSIEIRAAADGAPEVFLSGKKAVETVSISHSEGSCLCVISPRGLPVGCDLEMIAPRSDSFMSDFYAPEEVSLIQKKPSGEQALFATLIWSAKESASKTVREGLRLDTRSFVAEPGVEDRSEDWSLLAVTRVDQGLRLNGWWRRWGEYIQTVTVQGPADKPLPLKVL